MNVRSWGKGRGAYTIPVGCALLALATVLWASNRSGGDSETQADVSLEIPSGVSREVADAMLSSSAEASSPEAFLRDLDESPDGGGDSEAVSVLSWTEARDLPAVAEEVLCAYRDHGAVTLMASGYLDLSGNVWAALLRHNGGAVDIMTVATADGHASEVRVARLEPDGL